MLHRRQCDQHRQRRNGQDCADEMADGVEVFVAVWGGDEWVEGWLLEIHGREYNVGIVYRVRRRVAESSILQIWCTITFKPSFINILQSIMY